MAANNDPLPPVGYNAREEKIVNNLDDPQGQTKLRTLDIACLIINKQIGAGIYTTPATVLLLTQNKVGALLLWIFGGAYSFLSIVIWLEYGWAWPYNGGEFLYVTKIFPKPPLIACCAFAWTFVAFSTSVANGFNFAKFFLYTWINNPGEWLLKFLACAIVIAISFVHYRLVNIGIKANNLLAGYKVIFLSFLIITGFVSVCIKGGRGTLRGRHDFGHTQTNVDKTRAQCFTEFNWSNITEIGTTPIVKPDAATGPVNVVVAILLVFFSYSGWENANYVTSEIEGNTEQRKKRLKDGALWAVGITTVLYILFNLFLFFLLDFCTIANPRYSAAYEFTLEAFNSSNTRDTRRAICICIALSACGNLVGTIFTNIRVKRDIALSKVIPFHRYFGMSSQYGQRTWDGLGTPTGGIMLHILATCITIAATPFYSGPQQEGQTFVVNLFTYAHSVLSFMLGFGLFYLKRRMDENQTAYADKADAAPAVPFQYRLLTNDKWRYIVAISMMVINLFIVIATFTSSDYPSGAPRKIGTYILPLVVLGMYGLGALVGVFIIQFAWNFEFKSNLNNRGNYFLNYDERRWWFNFDNKPTSRGRDSYWTTLGNFWRGRPQANQRPRDEQPLNDTEMRWGKKGESDSALLLRSVFERADGERENEALREEVRHLRPDLAEEYERLQRRRRWVREKEAIQPGPNGAVPNVTVLNGAVPNGAVPNGTVPGGGV